MDQKEIMDSARQSYSSFENFVTPKEEDSTLVIIGKVILRLIGILVIILLSPFLLVGLLIAFMAVL